MSILGKKRVLGFLLREKSGVAAVEFAMIAPMLLALALAVLDYGYAFSVKIRVINSVSSTAQAAYNKGKTVTPDNVHEFLSDIKKVVSATAGLSDAATVKVLFNNSESGSAVSNYYCVSGAPLQWTSTGARSVRCRNGIQSGKFVTIAVSGEETSLFKGNMSFGGSLTVNETAIVRVR